MTNKEILNALSKKRAVTDYARFLNVTPRTVYNILKSEKIKDNQYYNFIRFVLNEYTKEKKPRKSI